MALTAGDEHAQDVQNVCDPGGVKVLLTTPHRYEAGDSVAITAISALAKKHSVMKARQILEVVAKAGLVPIKDAHMKAAELLMVDLSFATNSSPRTIKRRSREKYNQQNPWRPMCEAKPDGAVCELLFCDLVGSFDADPGRYLLDYDGYWFQVDPPGRVYRTPTNWRPAFAKLTPERRHSLKKQADRA